LIHVVKWSGTGKKHSWIAYPGIRKEFARIIAAVQPDLIHAGPVQRVALLAALNDFHPLVTMSWGFDMLQDADRNPFWRMVTRFVLQKSDWLIADCHTVKKKASAFGFDTRQSTVFPWGVDLDLFSPSARKEARKQIGFENEFLIIHTRSWEPRYGVDIALQGFRKALDKNPAMHILMLGGGSQQDMIHRYVNTHHLADHVHFIGYMPNQKLAQYYRAGDIYLSASHVDGSSVALLEAMACGCVPIVSNIPSNLEWVKENETGWSFHDGSGKDLSETLLEIYQMDLKDIRRKARKKIEREADWDQGKKQLMQAYQNAIMQVGK